MLKNIKLTGVSFGPSQGVIRDLILGSCIYEYDLVRDFNNQHDQNAVKALCCTMFLGWIPRDLNSRLASAMDNGRRFQAELVRIIAHPDYPTKGVIVHILEIS